MSPTRAGRAETFFSCICGCAAAAARGDRVTVDETTGQITFSNLNNLSLQKDVDVTVNVEVAYPWAVKSGKVTYKILK